MEWLIYNKNLFLMLLEVEKPKIKAIKDFLMRPTA
jgi:hypothetical protein